MKKTINGFPVEAIIIGQQLNIFIGSDEAAKDKEIRKGLADGHSVTRNGVKIHHDWRVICDLSLPSSEQYIWDASGNRVKGDLIEVTTHDGAIISERVLKQTYRNWE